MFNRQIITALKQWKNQDDRKPLILRGARQVGKTTVVELFSKEFENYMYLNLELGRDRQIFNSDLTARELFQALLVIKNMNLKEGNTLIFMDEIQNSPEAVAMLRYFYENMPHLHVIAAGSLLEITLEKADIAFPVGRVEYMYLYPVTFTEYLEARGEQILDVYHQIPLQPYARARLMTLFHEYALIGGMPEIVKRFIKTDDVGSLNRTYESLLISYINDAEKYARNHTIRQVLRHAIESIPFEAGNRIKFQGFGKSGYLSREMGEALRTIEKAMLIYLIYPSTSVQIPVRTDLRKSPKLQFIDTGLLNYFVGLQPDYYTCQDLQSFYQGILAEHIVRQELTGMHVYSSHPFSFWVREKPRSNAEVDILVQHRNLVIPVEVKAGKSGTLKSLHQFINQTNHGIAVRLYAGEFSITDTATPQGKPYRLLNLPYCLAGKLFEYLEWFMEESHK